MRMMSLCLAAALATPMALATEEPATPRTLVEIDGSPITELHFALYRNQQQAGEPGTAQESMVALNKLVNMAILAQKARSDGLPDNPEVRAALEIAEIEVLAQAALRNHINANPVTEEELQERFAARYSGEPRTEYKARHILVESEDKARVLIAELEAGADFAELAKAHSTGPSGPQGGDLGWFEADQMVAPFAEATRELEKGEFTREPVQTQFGWHVIRLDDLRTAGAVKLDDVRDELLTELHRERAATYMNDARQSVTVTVTPPPDAPAAEQP